MHSFFLATKEIPMGHLTRCVSPPKPSETSQSENGRLNLRFVSDTPQAGDCQAKEFNQPQPEDQDQRSPMFKARFERFRKSWQWMQLFCSELERSLRLKASAEFLIFLATATSLKVAFILNSHFIDPNMAVGQNPVPPVNIPIPTKIGSKTGGAPTPI